MTDARPVPPERPLPADCCGGGCDPCVHDLHAEAMAAYARLLASWEARQGEAVSSADEPPAAA